MKHTTRQDWIHQLLEHDSAQLPAGRLRHAIEYALLAGGKRLRPALILAAVQSLLLDRDRSTNSYNAESAGGTSKQYAESPDTCELISQQPDAHALITSINAAACAVEYIHTYSLVHDDLPAMDDDDLRRGQATCHKKFDEAEAILAGDAMQARAMEVLLAAKIDTTLKNSLALNLARCSGAQGMVRGQSLDMLAESNSNAQNSAHLSFEDLELIHQLKTGALFRFCLAAAGLICDVTPATIDTLEQMGILIGQSFQIKDDVLDSTRSSLDLGKSASDAGSGKFTYVSLLGIDGAHAAAERLDLKISELLARLGGDNHPLQILVNSMRKRRT